MIGGGGVKIIGGGGHWGNFNVLGGGGSMTFHLHGGGAGFQLLQFL